ncbi:hypothetical protein K458DRAFT_411620 [Lentithecium fluviatile CBS 122367]|uniref:BRCT domain-containing protein n=1 Tax=Lentithecium fluviatile CBS 122367 TaxID=1168545 RepID=A0A6G1JMW8_9PLEO|nr:hypothetical protein K458DRAFT_411620 [Lentithecium fluviatile CBS 122367]
MVATRSGRGAKAPEVDPPANNTLKAPPKRAGKRKAVDDAPAEPAAKVAKPTKPEPKKKAAPKAATKAAPKAAAKTTRRAAKAIEPVETVEEKPEPEPVTDKTDEPKTTRRTARGRKAAVAPVVEVAQPLPVVIEEPVAAVAEPTKPATRAKKQPVPKANSKALRTKPLGTTAAATRVKRDRHAAIAPPAESPLKAPARKPARKPATKAATASKMVEHETAAVVVAEEPFAEYPNYPNTPAHINAPLSSRVALRELPVDYPKTPAHISGPMSHKDAMAELPGYPKTPSHISAPISHKDAIAELPNYPKTPVHITAAVTTKKALDELPDYPKTPAHIAEAISNQKAFDELAAEYPTTPAHVEAAWGNQKALNELPAGYPRTPAHVAAMLSNQQALDQLSDYPQTPAHITAPLKNEDALKELAGYPQTPAHIRAPMTIQEGLAALPSYPNTPKLIEATVDEEAVSYTPEAIENAVDEEAALNTPVAIETTVNEDAAFNTPQAVEATVVNEAASSPVSEPEEISFELTGPIQEIQPESSLINGDESPVVHDGAGSMRESSVIPRNSTQNVFFAAPELPSSASSTSPSKRSALRSPVKADMKTPKKTVTWNDDDSEPEFLLHGGPLRGMKFFVDVTSNGKDQSFLFTGLLEDMGAQVERTWDNDTFLTHVLYKDGKKTTLDKVVASNGKVKCVNVGWILDSEKNQKRMEETPYLVDLAVHALSPPKSKMAPFTPAKTPSKYLMSIQEKSSSIKSVPSTPTSSEFDRSINFDEKENSEIGIFFTPKPKTCPRQPMKPWMLNRSPVKTPSRFEYLKQAPLKAFSTTKKRSAPESFDGLSGAPKKLRFL